jgi:CubicO group peptidase (beta-lactamase class C family)
MNMKASEIHGSCDAAFANVRDTFAEHFARHPVEGGPAEVGAAVSVVVDGRCVVDLWAGHRDAARSQPWTRDTIVMVASATKGLVALVANRLIDQGRLDPEANVGRYWPEYSRGAKSDTLVRHLLCHQAGLPALREDLGPGGIWEWDRVVHALADAEPAWVPGTAHGYHPLTWGHLVGEVIRRIDGRNVGDIVREDLAGPLGVPFELGFDPAVPPGSTHVCADFIPPPESSPFANLGRIDPATDFASVSRLDDPRLYSPAAAGSACWKRAGFPAAAGYTNARTLARVYGALARGGQIDGVRVLGADTLAARESLGVRGRDRTWGVETAFAAGWQIPSNAMLPGGGSTSFGHPGGWGSLGWADPELRLGFGYVMSQTWSLAGDPRATRLYTAAQDCARSSQ